MVLPESNLAALTVTEHSAHHVELHKINNLLVTAVDGDGAVLVKLNTGSTSAALGVVHSHYNFPDHYLTVNHTAAGPLTILVTAATRVVDVVASANITGLAVGAMELLGQEFGSIMVRIQATAAITMDLTGVGDVLGAPPTTLANGEGFTFLYQRWLI